MNTNTMLSWPDKPGAWWLVKTDGSHEIGTAFKYHGVMLFSTIETTYEPTAICDKSWRFLPVPSPEEVAQLLERVKVLEVEYGIARDRANEYMRKMDDMKRERPGTTNHNADTPRRIPTQAELRKSIKRMRENGVDIDALMSGAGAGDASGGE